MKKKLKIAGILLAIMIVYLGFTNYPKLDLISGFSAKALLPATLLAIEPSK
jgi:hypothetical protein